MTKNTSKRATENLVESIVAGMQEKKAKDIVTLDLQELDNAVCDYFIICHGDSDRQVSAIAKSIDKVAKEKAGESPWHTEGLQNAEWVLLDYVNVVAHVFKPEAREFYNLEGLWADAEIKQVERA